MESLDLPQRAVAELSELLRWNSGEHPPAPPLGQAEAEQMAREVLGSLLSLPDDVYPKQLRRRGLQFILHEEPGLPGRKIYCSIWDGERWRELGDVEVPAPGGVES
ncbi:MAG: hypothetical protein QJR14_06095 [Bacillota bacterium]|nr:hypothetical protein [Bacillota bacterium]